MKIAHLTYIMSARGGGVPPVAAALAKEHRAAGHDATVVGVRDGAPPICDAEVFACLGPLVLGLAPGIGGALRRLAPDVVHLHGLYTWSSHDARAWGRRTARPVVITPHGMLEPWALARSAWKKRLFNLFVEDANLRHASCLHALHEEEAANLRRLGLPSPIAVIPNGVELPPEGQGAPSATALVPEVAGRRVMLFLGRVHPKKGLVNLIRAWSQLRDSRAKGIGDWALVIAGPDQVGHAAELGALVKELGLGADVILTGPRYGAEKDAILSAASAFVLPSFSEGFSMAVLEAMAHRLPVLITHECHFDVESLGAGLLYEPTCDSVTAMMRGFLERSEKERVEMGARGRAAVAAHYTWSRVAAQVLEVYRWLVEGAPAPGFVRRD